MRYRSMVWMVVAAAAVSAALAGPGAQSAYGMRPARCLARWHSVDFPMRGRVEFLDVAVAGSRAWALGRSERGAVIERWRAPRWRRMPLPALTTNDYIDAIAANGPNDVWVVGTRSSATDSFAAPISFHWDGRSWARIHVPKVPVDPLGGGGGWLTAVTAIEPDDVWAVGLGHEDEDGGIPALVVHWNGSTWRRYPWWPMADVAGDSTGDLWFVGSESKEVSDLLASARIAGEPFESVAVDWSADWMNSWFTAVAAGPSDVWAVGEWDSPDARGPIIERWQSGQFVLVPVEGSIDGGLSDVAVTGTHAFAVGSDSLAGPVIERWRNGVWRPVHLPAGWADRSLTHIAAGPDGSVWAVGSFIARSCIGPV